MVLALYLFSIMMLYCSFWLARLKWLLICSSCSSCCVVTGAVTGRCLIVSSYTCPNFVAQFTVQYIGGRSTYKIILILFSLFSVCNVAKTDFTNIPQPTLTTDEGLTTLAK